MSSFNSRKTLAKFCIFSRKNECIYFKLRFYFRDNLIYSNNKLHFVVVLCGYKCVDHCRKHALPTSSMHWYVAEQCNTFMALMKHQRKHFTVYVLNYVFLWFSLQLSINHFKHSKTFKYWKYCKFSSMIATTIMAYWKQQRNHFTVYIYIYRWILSIKIEGKILVLCNLTLLLISTIHRRAVFLSM